MKEQWLRDLQDKEKSEEEWEAKVEVLAHRLKEKEDILLEREVALRERESAVKLLEEANMGKDKQITLQAHQIASFQQSLSNKDSIAADL